jgi:diguanylate cyclase (GGDEF)-like protein
VTLGLLACLALVLIDDDQVSSWVYLVLVAVSLLIGMASLGHRVRVLSGWSVLLAGGAAWLVSDLLRAQAGQRPLGAGADLLYVVGAALVLAALVMLGHERRAFDRHGLLVGFVVVAGWSLVIWRLMTSTAFITSASVLTYVYAGLDLVMLLVLVALIRSRAASVGERLAWAGGGLWIAGDTVFALGGGAARPQESVWLAAFIMIAAAPWYASRAVAAPLVNLMSPARRDVILMAVSGLALPASALLLGLRDDQPDIVVVGIAQVVLTALLIVRVQSLLAETSRQADQVARLAETDPLTGLPNSHRFVTEASSHLVATLTEPLRPTLVLVGLESFAELHDRLGHRAGDELMRAVARRVVELVPEAACVAHMSADVFGVVLLGQTNDRALSRAQRLAEALRDPLELSQLSVTVRPVVGLATADQGMTDGSELMANADLALAAARGSAGPVVRFSSDLERRDALSAQLVGELAEAITRGEVLVYFQPQVELSTGRVTGAEALVRWLHPALGLLGPAAFVPAAEATGTIRVLTLHVLDQALYWCARWAAAGRSLNVAVNLSARDLMHSRLVEDVREALVRYGLPANRLELEITETMAMADLELSQRVLTDLARLGVTISIDDYGTGYGSLAYLQKLPVRRLKIDRSFVSRVLDDEASTAIVRSTIELAGQLGLDTVAEGVEDDATVQRLRDFGCSTVQGFGLAAPMSPEGFERAIWRLEHRTRTVRTTPSPTGSVATVRPPSASFPSVARAYRELAEPSRRIVPASPDAHLTGAEEAIRRAAAPTRRSVRDTPPPATPHQGAGSVTGLRAAAASERTTGTDPA